MEDQYLTKISASCLAIKEVPQSLLEDEEFVIKAVDANPLIFELLRDEVKTDKVKLHTATKYGYLLPHIINPTREMIIAALKSFGRALEHVISPDKEMYYIAVLQDGRALKFVPKEYRDKDLCLLALNNGGVITDVPPSVIDDDFYRLGVTHDWFYLNQVPEEYRTFDVCLEAVKKSRCNLADVPKDLKSRVESEVSSSSTNT